MRYFEGDEFACGKNVKMISMARRGGGGDRLAEYLTFERDDEVVCVEQARGLLSVTFEDQMRELTAISLRARSAKPIMHLFARLPGSVQARREEIYGRHRELIECEFDLVGQPCAVVSHVGSSGEHFHFVYSLVKPEGHLVDLSYDFARREKVGRIVEFEFGLSFTPGRHNRAVIHALRQEGRGDVAQAMIDAGLHEVQRPKAVSNLLQGRIERVTGIRRRDIAFSVFDAWAEAADNESFVSNLSSKGLTPRLRGEVVGVVDEARSWHAIKPLFEFSSRQRMAKKIDAEKICAGLALMLAHGTSHESSDEKNDNSFPWSRSQNTQLVDRELMRPNLSSVSSVSTGGRDLILDMESAHQGSVDQEWNECAEFEDADCDSGLEFEESGLDIEQFGEQEDPTGDLEWVGDDEDDCFDWSP